MDARAALLWESSFKRGIHDVREGAPDGILYSVAVGVQRVVQ
jgi:hypothetical protein